MIETLKITYPIARKDYMCVACIWLREFGTLEGNELEFTFSEMRSIVKAKQKGWKIKKGERYLRATNVDCGVFSEFVAIPEIDDICQKYKIYEE